MGGTNTWHKRGIPMHKAKSSAPAGWVDENCGIYYKHAGADHRGIQRSRQGTAALTKSGQLREARPSGVISSHSRRTPTEGKSSIHLADLKLTQSHRIASKP